jgi:hypothetical protein
MVGSTLSVLSSPKFPQVFEASLTQFIERVLESITRAQSLALCDLARIEHLERCAAELFTPKEVQ